MQINQRVKSISTPSMIQAYFRKQKELKMAYAHSMDSVDYIGIVFDKEEDAKAFLWLAEKTGLELSPHMARKDKTYKKVVYIKKGQPFNK